MTGRVFTNALFGGVLLAGMLLSGTARAEEKALHVYNWSDYIGETTIADFEKETGIKVRYDMFDSYEAMDAKILVGSTGYDIIFPGATSMFHQIPAGLYRKIDREKLSNYGNLDPDILAQLAVNDPGNEHVVPYLWWTTGISVNKNRVQERMPDAPLDSLAMLFDPEILAKLKDCGIYWVDDPLELFGLALLYIGKDPNSADPADIRAAADMMQKARPYLTQIATGSMINALAGGDACVAVTWSGDHTMAAARAEEAGTGHELAYFVPREGSSIGFDGMAILSDAPHPEAALTFINYMLRPEVIAKATDETGYANANKAAYPMVDPALTGDPAIYPDAEMRARLFVRKPREADNLRLVLREWQRVKIGQ